MDLIARASPYMAKFDYSGFLSGCGRDIMNIIFECCPMGTLARFAGTSHDARQSVQDYVRLQIHRLLKPFIGLGLSFFVGDCCLLIYWVESENLTTFWNLLTENNSAIVGSIALKVLLNGCDSSWMPQDLNIAVPRGGLRVFSGFLRGLGYQLSGTGVRSRFIDGAFTHSIYVNSDGNAVTVTEALSTDSFFSVVVGSGHTGLMNFVSSEHLGCLYPTQTLKEHTAYAYRRCLGTDAYYHLRRRGFDLIMSSRNHPCNDRLICPVTHRQLSGFSAIGLFEWMKRMSPSNFLTRSYSWSLGDECLNHGCLIQSLEQYLKKRKYGSEE